MELASVDGGAPLAAVAHGLGVLMDQQGEAEAARRLFELSLAIGRQLGDLDRQARALNSLGIVHRHLDDIDTARALLEESIAINREIDSFRLPAVLANLGQLENAAGNLDRAAELAQEALERDLSRGDLFGAAIDQHTLALIHLRAGRAAEARSALAGIVGYIASLGNISMLINSLELAAAIAAGLGAALPAARLAGAAESLREESSMPISDQELAMMEALVAPARSTVTAEAWDAELSAGRALGQQEATDLISSVLHDGPGP
jgi:tetratricopeptide (TPR) repeat protein